MQTILLDMPTVDIDQLSYQRAALRECIAYGEHGEETEIAEDGREVCFNCGGSV
jgi:hypothetical protein